MQPVVDGKSALNQFCQRHCGRPLYKDDITYTTRRFGTQYQSIVKLVCLNGEQYAGETKLNPKESQKSAAWQALQAHAAERELYAQKPAEKPKSKLDRASASKASKGATAAAPAAAPGSAPAAAVENGEAAARQLENPALTPKVRLNTACMKIAHRYLKKGETVYQSNQVLGGFQATVQLTCLPDEWSLRVWAGEVCLNKQKAEQSAAAIALAQVLEEPSFAEALAANGRREADPTAAAKGEGRGKRGFKGVPKEMEWMLRRDARQTVETEEGSPLALTGEVLEWKGSYGWIKPKEQVDHPAAAFRGGKIYVKAKDIVGADSLAAGASVRFNLYFDIQGLGAEEVTVL
eukprot:TRINITY_DN31772_c0_g1_i1.p1 TRINITY_DN31772_c0_g1~~TRINITY_DN31772_c0_g1_i1.p1  ORF type:complete len:348 (-),score=86.86 TRINITY_DN31772_c0_g1_i1:89-1132(-)